MSCDRNLRQAPAETIKDFDPRPLLPCPFCGGRAKIVKWTKRGGDDHYTANCTSCDATATDESDRDEAIVAWNTRHEYRGTP